ncbi:MAG TPA: hypothetical protein VM842_01115, partial [Nitrospira sp.]|nr:hypothetical protein [Nitrospira sp.]
LKNCCTTTDKGLEVPHMASFRFDLERRSTDGIPNLAEVESGKLLGAVLPMSEQAQLQLRDSIEVIDYLMNQEAVVWS